MGKDKRKVTFNLWTTAKVLIKFNKKFKEVDWRN